jgi:hypothetical protein
MRQILRFVGVYDIKFVDRGSGGSPTQNVYCPLVQNIRIFFSSYNYHLLFYVHKQ